MQRLPFELRILADYLQTTKPIASSFRLSFASPPPTRPAFLRRSSTSSAPPPTTDLFEPKSNEYLSTPASILDSLPTEPLSTPRSPTHSLLRLARLSTAAEADALLLDLRQSRQQIKSHPEFLRFAFELFENDVESNWIDWWSFASYKSPSSIKEIGEKAKVVLDLLLCDRKYLEQTRRFGLLLARQKCQGIVADRLLVHGALLGEHQVAEELWRACVLATERQALEDERSARSMFQHLRRKRQQMTRAYATTGRLDLAFSLVQSTHLADPERRFNIESPTYHYLLSIFAQANRFDLFSHLYQTDIGSNVRLVRADSPALRRRSPYIVRSSKSTHPIDQTPSVQEAFSTLRFANFSSPLEEIDDSSYLSIPDASDPSFDTPSRRRSTHNDPELDERFSVALNSGSVKASAAAFIECIRASQTPSRNNTAYFISLCRSQGMDSVVESISRILVRHRLRGYWESSVMLEFVKRGERVEALRTFKKVFKILALPKVLTEEIEHVIASSSPSVTVDPSLPPPPASPRLPTIMPDARTLSIVLESLITPSPTPRNVNFLTLAYSALVTTPSSFSIKVSPSQLALPSDSNAHTNPSTLDRSFLLPYTFLPFLQAFAKLRKSPIELLCILKDMQTLQIDCPNHHWGVVLASFALDGSFDDLLYLLDFLSGKAGINSRKPSEQLEGLIKGMKKPREWEMGIEVYTSSVWGLMLRGESGKALELVEGMPSELEKKKDDRWRDVERRLRIKTGGERRRELKVRERQEGEGEMMVLGV